MMCWNYKKKIEAFPHQESSLLQLELSVEEAYVNIASYAYPEGTWRVTVGLKIDEKPSSRYCGVNRYRNPV